ncbi:DUF6078 family protein [Bacteroides sp. 519]|uniref:DUF6078 family protein n=1 Tax=Bacteroides sp. 519 TaxID=2302937 RepID=UPI0013D02F83|nr:DUF6078 family protein [Bacteroides sp. 519]NDV60648.1 hypothetical protein [Bacteroides sp. 519]
MENKFDYQSVPANYNHCFNEQCSRKNQCMRYLVAQNSTSQYPSLCIVNPKCIPNNVANCPFFKSVSKVRLAWGIRHLLDNVPYKDGSIMRKQLISYFGRNIYYRIYRSERGLLPEEQEYIRQLFHKNGIEKGPEFERYTDEYYFG